MGVMNLLWKRLFMNFLRLLELEYIKLLKDGSFKFSFLSNLKLKRTLFIKGKNNVNDEIK